MINCSTLLCQNENQFSRLHYTKPKAPVIVWNLTSECNLSCRHCYAASVPQQNDGRIPIDNAKEFIDDIYLMNIPALLFSGGEPLLREDIFQLGYYAALRGIYTALSTNGTLITDEVAKKIKEAQFKYVGISLDGLEDAHDNFRLQKGSFSLSIKGIDNCLKHGIKTGVRFTLTKYNYHQLNRLMTFLVHKKINRFCLYHLVYSEKTKAGPEDDIVNSIRRDVLASFFSTVQAIIDNNVNMEILTVDNHADGVYLYHLLKNGNAGLGLNAKRLFSSGSGCSAAKGIASVDPYGEVHPCQFWRHVSLGNIKERKFSEIWSDKNNEFLNMLRNSRKLLKGRCGRCIYKSSCGGCRLRAEKKFRDIWQEDPACYLTEEEIKGI